jgi:hypothetical protein
VTFRQSRHLLGHRGFFLQCIGHGPASGRPVLLRAATQAAIDDFIGLEARGRTINLVIGYSVGGGYDIHGRVLARHLGKHMPGNPAIVVQNMPGGGSLRAANFLYNAAPKDGTTIGVFSRGMARLCATECAHCLLRLLGPQGHLQRRKDPAVQLTCWFQTRNRPR